jgi:hypothetical protein
VRESEMRDGDDANMIGAGARVQRPVRLNDEVQAIRLSLAERPAFPLNAASIAPFFPFATTFSLLSVVFRFSPF